MNQKDKDFIVILPDHGKFQVNVYQDSDGKEYFFVLLGGFDTLGPYPSDLFTDIQKAAFSLIKAYTEGYEEGEHSGFDKAAYYLKKAPRDWDKPHLGSL